MPTKFRFLTSYTYRSFYPERVCKDEFCGAACALAGHVGTNLIRMHILAWVLVVDFLLLVRKKFDPLRRWGGRRFTDAQ